MDLRSFFNKLFRKKNKIHAFEGEAKALLLSATSVYF
jgi:hypothetical protein